MFLEFRDLFRRVGGGECPPKKIERLFRNRLCPNGKWAENAVRIIVRELEMRSAAFCPSMTLEDVEEAHEYLHLIVLAARCIQDSRAHGDEIAFVTAELRANTTAWGAEVCTAIRRLFHKKLSQSSEWLQQVARISPEVYNEIASLA